MTRRWFFPGIAVFITNKTDRHDIAEILLKMALNTITYFFKQNRMLINMYKHALSMMVVLHLNKDKLED